MEQQLQQRVDIEVARRQMDERERRVHALCRSIQEDVLTLKAKCCGRAFFDFDGCFAVKCGCGHQFCGWCLADCGADAHPHVCRCPQSLRPGRLFGSRQEFERAHRLQRVVVLRRMLRAEADVTVRQDVVTALRGDLNDLGLQLIVDEFVGRM